MIQLEPPNAGDIGEALDDLKDAIGRVNEARPADNDAHCDLCEYKTALVMCEQIAEDYASVCEAAGFDPSLRVGVLIRSQYSNC